MSPVWTGILHAVPLFCIVPPQHQLSAQQLNGMGLAGVCCCGHLHWPPVGLPLKATESICLVRAGC